MLPLMMSESDPWHISQARPRLVNSLIGGEKEDHKIWRYLSSQSSGQTQRNIVIFRILSGQPSVPAEMFICIHLNFVTGEKCQQIFCCCWPGVRVAWASLAGKCLKIVWFLKKWSPVVYWNQYYSELGWREVFRIHWLGITTWSDRIRWDSTLTVTSLLSRLSLPNDLTSSELLSSVCCCSPHQGAVRVRVKRCWT